MPHGDPLGTHRVLEPQGSLPQPAWRLDNDGSLRFDTEIHVAVEALNIDAASFHQMEGVAAAKQIAIADQVLETVAKRGKQHNPVTGSGGMLLGRVIWVGPAARARGFQEGERVATLASLSLTPLALTAVHAVRPESGQLDVTGTAIVFQSAPLARMPEDFPDRVALALLDVAGAAPQVARHAKPGSRVVVLGAGGKSGLLASAAASRAVGPHGWVVGVEPNARNARELMDLGLCRHVVEIDATQPIAVQDRVLAATGGEQADLVVSCVNVNGVEPAAILLTRPRGSTYFFAMSTSFTAAALVAEGMSKDIDMYIGNGYAEGHADETFDLVRSMPALAALLSRRYG
jgi:L-erythro-3,5-diaminohexanoate dehydrogenase